MGTIFNRHIFAVLCFGTLFTSCKKKDEAAIIQSPYISKILDYVPAPGQFINDKSYGTLAKAQDLIGTVDNGLLSLGGYGGYIIFGFDHPIVNQTGNDLGIFGNPLISVGAEWSEPGIVMVSQDSNHNGLADDTWYEIAGSEYDQSQTIKNYRIMYYNPKNLTDDVSWADNQGNSGVVLRNAFHAQEYYPQWLANQNEVSFTGTLLKNTLLESGVITNTPFNFGYADTGSPEYLDMQNTTGRGYNAFDIDWAVDGAGRKVWLQSIDFVKVYTGQNCNGNPYPTTTNPRSRYLGEVSTEIGGAIDIRLYNQLKK